jgi:hypothetical protein
MQQPFAMVILIGAVSREYLLDPDAGLRMVRGGAVVGVEKKFESRTITYAPDLPAFPVTAQRCRK